MTFEKIKWRIRKHLLEVWRTYIGLVYPKYGIFATGSLIYKTLRAFGSVSSEKEPIEIITTSLSNSYLSPEGPQGGAARAPYGYAGERAHAPLPRRGCCARLYPWCPLLVS